MAVTYTLNYDFNNLFTESNPLKRQFFSWELKTINGMVRGTQLM